MFKIPHLDVNCIPSQLNTSAPTGVSSQLANAGEVANYDGISLEEMVGNPLYERIDDIDKRGLAIQKMADSAKTVKSRGRQIRALNDAAQRISKPNPVK